MFFLILLPVCFALPTLPEVFQSFSVTHPSISALSAVAVATTPTNDVYIAGSAHPRQDGNLTLHGVGNDSRSLPFLAHLSPDATLVDLHILDEALVPSHLLFHHNHLFLIGNTANHSIYVNKLDKKFNPVWNKALVFGSPGVDFVSAVTVDAAHYFPHIFIAGRVGARAFEPPKRADSDLHAAGIEQDVVPVAGRVSKDAVERGVETEDALVTDVPTETVAPANFNQGIDRDADAFLAKVHPDSGELMKAVQLELEHDNSADGLVVHDGVVYASVNSYEGAPFDPAGTNSLHTFSAKDLAHREIYLPSDCVRRGDYIHAMANDVDGNIYMAGFSLGGDRMEKGVYIIRKYNVGKKMVEWERELGKHLKVEPKVCITVGRMSGNVFVCGHTAGLYQAETPEGGMNGSELLRLPLTMFSTQGKEVISWDRISPYPLGYEEISAICLDKDENVVYAGKWVDPSDRLADGIVGSFGASWFMARAAEVEENESGMGYDESAKGGGLGGATIGLICLAAGIGVVVMGAAVGYGRWQYTKRKGLVMGPSYDSDDDEVDDILDMELGSADSDELERGAQMAVRRRTMEGEEVGGSAQPM